MFGGLPQNASLNVHLAHTHSRTSWLPCLSLTSQGWQSLTGRYMPRAGPSTGTPRTFTGSAHRHWYRKQHPDWSASQVEAVVLGAVRGGCRGVDGRYLKLGQALRLRASGGFYNFLSATTMTLKVPTIPASVHQTSVPRMTSAQVAGAQSQPSTPASTCPQHWRARRRYRCTQHRVLRHSVWWRVLGTPSCRCCLLPAALLRHD